jgi:NodT family efflux transporter outer membrane factor (OMF) lipoprotein
MIHNKLTSKALTVLTAILLSACVVGPDYVRPTPLVHDDMPVSFKENWKTAEPQDHIIPSKWWTLFNDDNLNTLIEQVATSNLTLAQAEANYRAAHALVDNARAAYFPSLTGNLSSIRSKSSENGNTVTTSKGVTTTYNVGVTASWELDLWGAIRRSVEAQENTALSSFANVQATRLSMQSLLAQNYFQLRVLDVQKELLDRTVNEYERALTLTQHQYKSGVVASDSVLLAQTQLHSTQAQALDVGIQRAQFEHAIAVLIGKPPGTFSIPAIPMGEEAYMPDMPDIPVALPSSLLERRPDVAAAERSVAAANAQIGVTKAAFFPTLTLGATGGYQSNGLANWLTLPNRFWSVGPALAATLFDGGAKRALNNQAIAQYDASVAAYRQTVLTAFQNVEDNLVSLRILKDEYKVQNSAAVSARKASEITLNQYKAGTVNYLNVVTAQTTALTNQRAELTITSSRLIAAVQLIAALGGGWDGLDNSEKVSN